jgi:hypothetical protein
MSTLPSQSALLDKNSFLKFTTYSLNNANTSSDSKVSSITQNNKPLIGSLIDNKNVVGSTNFYKTLTNSVFSNDLNFQNYLINFSKYYTLNLLTDKQDFTNPAKIIDSKKKNSTNSNVNTSFSDEFFSNTRGNFYSRNLFNESLNYKYKDFNSGNLKFLSFEKNNRNLANQKLRTVTQNLNENNDMGLNKTLSSNSNQYNLYLQGLNSWNNTLSTQKLLSNNTMSSMTRNPIQSTNPA